MYLQNVYIKPLKVLHSLLETLTRNGKYQRKAEESLIPFQKDFKRWQKNWMSVQTKQLSVFQSIIQATFFPYLCLWVGFGFVLCVCTPFFKQELPFAEFCWSFEWLLTQNWFTYVYLLSSYSPKSSITPLLLTSNICPCRWRRALQVWHHVLYLDAPYSYRIPAT